MNAHVSCINYIIIYLFVYKHISVQAYVNSYLTYLHVHVSITGYLFCPGYDLRGG